MLLLFLGMYWSMSDSVNQIASYHHYSITVSKLTMYSEMNNTQCLGFELL